LGLIGIGALALQGCTTSPDEHRDFIVDVAGERFVLRLTDPATIQQAIVISRGGPRAFPIGPLPRGAGGFNAPWSWHMDPDTTRLAEVAVEICDGMPSFVERNLAESLRPEVGYCPWAARIVGER
jgi:hypothetical protein